MKRSLLFFSLLTALLFTACVTTADIMEKHNGKTKSEIVMELGPPQKKVSDENGGEILVYYNSHTNITSMYYVNSEGVFYNFKSFLGYKVPD